MKRFFSILFSVSLALSATAQSIPALVIGGETKVPLQDIVSIKFGPSSYTVLCSDGSQMTEFLQPLSFGSMDAQGIRQLVTAKADGQTRYYDLMGRPVKLDCPTFPVVEQGSYAVTSQTRSAEDLTAMLINLPGISAMTTLPKVDSLSFTTDLNSLVVTQMGVDTEFAIADIKSIEFPEPQVAVTLNYSDNAVTGINPWALSGVNIQTEGANVVVNAFGMAEEVEYVLSGTSANGSFKIYSDHKWQATLQNLSLTNPVGPAINSQTGKKGTIKSPKGTVNTLCDGENYATSTEDQKGCVFGEGQLIFNGKGTLNVTSLQKHGICSDDYVSFDNGTINVQAAGDAVHAKDSTIVQAGVITLAPSSDGIDSDGPITIRKGENGMPKLTITTTGDGAKGIKTAKAFVMSDGNVTINQSGKSEVKDGDTSRVIGIKANSIKVTGGSIVINSSAEGGKAYSANTIEGEEYITYNKQ